MDTENDMPTTGTNNNFYIILAGVGILVIIFIFFCCIYNNKPSTNNTASSSDQNIVKIEMHLDEIPSDEIPSDEIPSDEIPSDEIPSDEIFALQQASLDASIMASQQASLDASIMASQQASLDASIMASQQSSLEASIKASQQASLEASIRASQQASLDASIMASQQSSLEAFPIITSTDINNIYGLYARYEADNYDYILNKWFDSSPNNNDIISNDILQTGGGVELIKRYTDDNSFTILEGDAGVQITFTTTPIINYTLIYICRYPPESTHKAGIITSNDIGNQFWKSGFDWGNSTGVSYTNQWRTASNTKLHDSWFIAVDTNYDYLTNNTSRMTTSAPYYLPPFGINLNSGNKSPFQVAEVIIFNRVLSSSEILAIQIILGDKYNILLENLSGVQTTQKMQQISQRNTQRSQQASLAASQIGLHQASFQINTSDDINNIYGLYARYKADNYNPSLNSWIDSSPNINNIISDNITNIGSIKTVTNNNKSFNILEGTVNSKIRFTSATINYYTLIYICRYTPNSANKRRIFASTGITSRWLSGFWYERSGISFTVGWRTGYNPPHLHNDRWFIAVDTPNDYLTNNTSRITTVYNPFYLPPFGINIQSYDKSDFQVAEVIIFNRVLSSSEILAIGIVLSNYYGIALENYPSSSSAKYSSSSSANI